MSGEKNNGASWLGKRTRRLRALRPPVARPNLEKATPRAAGREKPERALPSEARVPGTPDIL